MPRRSRTAASACWRVPTFARGCYGCFGPQDTPNTASIAHTLGGLGMSEPEVMRVFRTFNAASEAFLRESERHEGAPGEGREVTRP